MLFMERKLVILQTEEELVSHLLQALTQCMEEITVVL